MLPKERRDSGQNDLFRARLDQIVDLNHALARLGRAIDWRFLEERCGAVKVYTAGQKRGMTEQIKREMRRRSAIEPVIGHLKEDHRMGRNRLAGITGDAVNAVLAAVGYNFRRILAWVRFCVAIVCAALALSKAQNPIFKASNPMPAIV